MLASLSSGGVSGMNMWRACQCSAGTAVGARVGLGPGRARESHMLQQRDAAAMPWALGRAGVLLTLCIRVGTTLPASSWPFP